MARSTRFDHRASFEAEVDRELAKRIGRELFWEESLDRARETQLAETKFDSHFPATRQAEQAFVGRVGDRSSGSLGQGRRVFDPPEEGVRIRKFSPMFHGGTKFPSGFESRPPASFLL